MSKYRISVSIDGENFFWIVVDKGRFIRNTTDENLIGSKLKSYNKTNICIRCREESEREEKELTDKSILYPKNACKEKDKNGNETGEWVCTKHWLINYNRHNPNSYNNIIKSLADNRTGNINPNSNNGKGKKFQKLTNRWRSNVSTIPVKDLNEENDNYNSPIDHTRDSELGILQTIGRFYDPVIGLWDTSHLDRDWLKEFDHYIFYCMSKDGKYVERIYIFPKKEIYDPYTSQWRKSISVYKNPTDSHGNPITPWYEKYRVKDKNVLKKVNDIWKEI
jgi:hypothetical protein